MPEYRYLKGFQPSKKTRDLWCYILKKDADYIDFKMPSLFKSASSFITILVIGFLFIFILEGYATFGVAYIEGVPILSITFLIIIDILFAYLPHLSDGKICQKENELFVAKYSNEFTRLENDDQSEYQKRNSANMSRLEKEIFTLRLFKTLLYSLVIFSAFVKLYLFFQTYPFFNTYQAYIVISAYTISAVLHIFCTGNVIMYFLRFRVSLKKDINEFGNSIGQKNAHSDEYIYYFIDSSEVLKDTKTEKHDQMLTVKDGKSYIAYKGILLDEELSDLINNQTHYKQKLSVAVYGKKLQTSMLNIDGENNK